MIFTHGRDHGLQRPRYETFGHRSPAFDEAKSVASSNLNCNIQNDDDRESDSDDFDDLVSFRSGAGLTGNQMMHKKKPS